MKFILSDKLAAELGPYNVDVVREAMKAAVEEESGREHEWLMLTSRQASVLQPRGCNGFADG